MEFTRWFDVIRMKAFPFKKEEFNVTEVSTLMPELVTQMEGLLQRGRAQGLQLLGWRNLSNGKGSNSANAKLIKQLRQQTGAPIADVAKALYEANYEHSKAFELLRKKGIAAAAKKAHNATSEGAISLAFSQERNDAAMAETNAETDFAVRNQRFLQLALSVASFVQQQVAHSTVDAFSAQELSKDEVEQLHADTDTSVADMISQVAGEMRENVQARRAYALHVNPSCGVIGSYVHAPIAEGVGSLASLVALNLGSLPSSDVPVEYARRFADRLAMHVAASCPSYVRREDVPSEDIEHEKSVLREQTPADKPSHVVDKIVHGRLAKFFQENCLLEQEYIVEEEAGTVGDVLASRLPGATVYAFKRLKVGQGIKQD